MTRIPVILDTDIGGDIDDTWALAMLLKSPELDPQLVVSDTGDTTYRAKIIAKMLQVAERTDVPVGVGTPTDGHRTCNQGQWVEGYELADYPGTVHDDGVGAIIETILGSPEPVALICIGPVPNIAEALAREPRIADNARFVGMHGSLRKSHRPDGKVIPECNVVNGVAACRSAFTAPWDVTVTPLDTCGFVTLTGEKYQAVRHCEDPVIQALMENYRVWLENRDRAAVIDVRSSTLFDTVAVYLAFAEDLFVMEELGIAVTDDGYTVLDENARPIRVAAEWRDLDAFEDLLVARLTGGS